MSIDETPVDPGFNEATVAVASGPLVAPMLGRVIGMLAARADFPIDRLDDALLVADALAAKAGAFAPGGRVQVHVTALTGSVQLRVGPLLADGAEGLVASAALPGVGNVLEQVADEIGPDQSAADGDGEYLCIMLGVHVERPTTNNRMGSDAS